jgi:hypothetical protein
VLADGEYAVRHSAAASAAPAFRKLASPTWLSCVALPKVVDELQLAVVAGSHTDSCAILAIILTPLSRKARRTGSPSAKHRFPFPV